MEATVEETPQEAVVEGMTRRQGSVNLPTTPMARSGITFPLGFSVQEQELWFEAEEKASALSLQAVEIIKRGDTKVRHFFEMEVAKNKAIREHLQHRLEELSKRAERGYWKGAVLATPIQKQHSVAAFAVEEEDEMLLTDLSGLPQTAVPETPTVERKSDASRNTGTVPRGLPHFRGAGKDGIQDPTEFIERFETVCEPYSLDDSQLLRILPVCLDQVDGAWYRQWRKDNSKADWKAARQAFLAHFRHPNELVVLQTQIRALKMESLGVQRYSDQFRRLMLQLGWTSTTPEAVFQYKQGLTQSMLDRLSGAEASWELGSEPGKPRTITVDALVTMALRIEADRALDSVGEVSKTTRSVGSSHAENSRRETRECRYCHKYGHLERDCRKKMADERARVLSTRSSTSTAPATARTSAAATVTCFNCGEPGHYSNKCPRRKMSQDPAMKAATPSVKKAQVADDDISGKRVSASDPEMKTECSDEASATSANKQTACLTTPCILEGQKVMAFVDGGATTSFVDHQWTLKNNIAITPRSGSLTQFIDSSAVPRIGVAQGLCLENGKSLLRVDLEVADLSGSEEVIISIDLFEPLGYAINGVPFSWPSHEDSILADKTKKTVATVEMPPGVGEDGIADEWREIIARNQSISVFDLNAIPNSELHLPTGNNAPVYIRQYPIPEGLRAGVTERVELWKANGWVVPAPPGCQWNSPILAAKKTAKEVGEPDDIRVCIDSRALNERLINDPDSQLPLVHEIIDHLGPFQWITTLDLADSYHQFLIAEEDQEKLAFTWNGEQLMWRVAPFGVKTMPAHMQHQMEELLKPLKRTPFVDDLVIASRTAEDHKRDVLQVLEQLTNKG
jgi:hypothetical protein